MFRLSAAFAASAILLFQPALAQDSTSIAFDDVRVLTMQDGAIIEDGYVIIEGSRIAALGEGALPADFAGHVIDGDGATLMPGLSDMHVHWYETDMGAMFLANGITRVRNLTGSVWVLRRNQAALDGTLIAPRVDTSGPIIDGGEGFPNDFFVRARNADQAVGAVRSQARSSYDAVKLYSNLSEEAYRAAFAEARANDMQVYSHVPDSMTLGDLLELGVDSIEHLDGFAIALARDGFSTERDNAWPEYWANMDESLMDEWIERTIAANTWVVPTLAITYGRIASADPDAYFARPEAALLPSWASSWRGNIERFDLNRRYFEAQLANKGRFSLELYRAGGGVLIGTDAPNPFVTPGYSIHDELAGFAAAGFTNEEVLYIATAEAARFSGEEGRAGVVAEGAVADLILLGGDPLTDLDALRDLRGAMVNGHWHDRAAIDAALDARARRLAQ
ncbi:amidohydrolase family protein [Aurantiacibacter sp. MUD61]|uniref:amidohydrolase family protein n=1 Tax=Aurantiacibacter sp. MUD61 TaxID=3009083 RepID=UPI0022F08EA4|nr:amidohydrolase family protein [Aurantiacibacter sp. MUD61]